VNKEIKQEFVLAVEITSNYLQTGLYDYFGKNMASAQVPLFHEFTSNGLIESNPNDWLEVLKIAMRYLFARFYFRAEDIDSVVVTGDWGIVVPVNNEGNAIRNALVSAEGKSSFWIDEIVKGKISFTDFDVFKHKNWIKTTGSMPGAETQEAFANLIYIKNKLDIIYAQADMFLEAKDFIAFKLGAEACTTTDSSISNHLIDIENNTYVDKLFNYSELDLNKFPKIVEIAHKIGELNEAAAEELGLIPGISIISAPSLLQSSIIGNASFSMETSQLYLGYDAWISQAVNQKKIGNKEISMSQLNGNSYAHSNRFSGLKALDFYKRNFMFGAEPDNDYTDLFEMAQVAKPGAKKLSFIPFHAQNFHVDETFSGFYRTQYQHTPEDFARAIIEGTGFYSRLKFENIQTYIELNETINVAGLGAKYEFWCQVIANIFGRKTECTDEPELVALKGAAFMASIEKKRIVYEDIPSLVKVARVYEPQLKISEKYAYIFEQYKQLF
jgi:xylulokinase